MKYELHRRDLQYYFYRARDLDEKGKIRAKRQGFRHVRGIELDGSICGGGFYIKKRTAESPHHFCLKHLFAELHPQAQVESCQDGKRVDVVIISMIKVALEIETGNNNSEQIAEKAQWLNHNFDYWIIVCPRKHLGKYDVFVDYEKSFCCTVKKAKEKLLQLLTAIPNGCGSPKQ